MADTRSSYVELSEDFLFAKILSKLPAKSLMRFKCVCKSWLDRISGDSSFIEAHLNTQAADGHMMILTCYIGSREQRMTLHTDQGLKTKDLDMPYVIPRQHVIEIVGSCNGLVCLTSSCPGSSSPKPNFLMWNPATRQVRKLPNPAIRGVRKFEQSYGLGFDSASRDYKVVYLAVAGSTHEHLCAQVFAKSGAVWRGGEDERSRVVVVEVIIPPCGAVEANGGLHWAHWRYCNRPYSDISFSIISFCLRDEVLRVTDGPSGKWNTAFLCKWRASLAAVVDTKGGDIVMWVATSAGSDLRWGKLFETPQLEQTFFGILSDQLLLKKDVFNYLRSGTLLQLYNPKVTGVVREIKLPLFLRDLKYSHNYVESIISVF